MRYKSWFAVLAVLLVSSCSLPHHDEAASDQHEEHKTQYTSYSNDLELFAEADPFVISERANVLAHFSRLPDFKPVASGQATIVISVNGQETRQTLAAPTRTGIYSFDIQPATPGKGSMRFEWSDENGTATVVVPDVIVYASDEAAHAAMEEAYINKTNTTVFTKEQSWKIDFSTGHPEQEPFGQIIKTTALVQPSQSGERIVSASANGIISISNAALLEGQGVRAGQVLLTLSGSHLAENNIGLKYTEARNDYLKAEADYNRSKALAADKIVSEKELLAVQNEYENARAIYENLNKNANPQGQKVTSPISGFVMQVLVQNGAYVEAGQPLLAIAQLQSLTLRADVAQRYWPLLQSITSANIRTPHDDRVYTLAELNGKIVSSGRSTNSDDHLIPVYLQIDNHGQFIPGSHVEVLLQTTTHQKALTVPRTALLEEQGQFFVWVQRTPELFEKRTVQCGASDGKKIEIIQGITAAERIVTLGAIYIKLAQSTGALDAHSGHVH